MASVVGPQPADARRNKRRGAIGAAVVFVVILCFKPEWIENFIAFSIAIGLCIGLFIHMLKGAFK